VPLAPCYGVPRHYRWLVAATEVAGWVWSRNVRTLLLWAAHYVGYAFDDSDWQAVECALADTDDERQDGWYEYPLVGTPPLRVLLARSIGADPVQARVESSDVVGGATR